MSECAGKDCTRLDCTHGRALPDWAEIARELRRVESGIPPEKWSAMNRAERRAAMKGRRK